MISNMNDPQTLRNFSINNNNNKPTTIIDDVADNNNSHPSRINCVPISSSFDNGFNFSNEKYTSPPTSSEDSTAAAVENVKLNASFSANSYDENVETNSTIERCDRNFHSYSKSPDQQVLVVEPQQQKQQLLIAKEVNIAVCDNLHITGNDFVEDEEGEEVVNMNSLEPQAVGPTSTVPEHHARRPMNAFLIFCKRHRPIVREKYPNLENRAITKILGDWWANLDARDKSPFTNLAKQYKDAFFSANPDFKWYKLPAPPLRTLSTRPCNTEKCYSPDHNSSNYFYSASDFPPSPLAFQKEKQIRTNVEFHHQFNNNSVAKKFGGNRQNSVGVFKLADETQMGGLSSLLLDSGSTRKNDDNDCMVGGEEMEEARGMLHREPDSQQRYAVSSAEPLSNMRHHAEQMKAQTTKNLNNNNIKTPKDADHHSLKMNYRREIEQQWKNMDIDNKLNYSPHLENMIRSQTAAAAATSTITATPTPNHTDSVIVQYANLTPFKSPVASEQMENYDFYYTSPQKKSARSCKGKRYQEFMTGKMSPKKIKVKSTTASRNVVESGFPTSNHSTNTFPHNGYCKPSGAEAAATDDETVATARKLNASKIVTNLETQFDMLPQHNDRENNNVATANKMLYNTSDFDLEGKIKRLPCLSLDGYISRKRETKKKKKISSKSKSKNPKQIQDSKRLEVVGSQKRKARKESITRRDISTTFTSHTMIMVDEIKIEPESTEMSPLMLPSTPSFSLYGLATLAEVAAKESKLNNDDMIIEEN